MGEVLARQKLTSNVKRMIKKLFLQELWEDAGQGWEGIEDTLALSGWSRARRVVIVRRKLTGEMLLTEKDDTQWTRVHNPMNVNHYFSTSQLHWHSLVAMALECESPVCHARVTFVSNNPPADFVGNKPSR